MWSVPSWPVRRVELYIDPSETGSTLLSGTLVPSQESAPLILLRLACSCFDLRWMKAPPVDLSCRLSRACNSTGGERGRFACGAVSARMFPSEAASHQRKFFGTLDSDLRAKHGIACVLWRMPSRLHRRSSIRRSCHGPHRTQAGRSGVAAGRTPAPRRRQIARWASRVGPRFVPLFDQRSPRNKACLPDWPQALGRSALRD